MIPTRQATETWPISLTTHAQPATTRSPQQAFSINGKVPTHSIRQLWITLIYYHNLQTCAEYHEKTTVECWKAITNVKYGRDDEIQSNWVIKWLSTFNIDVLNCKSQDDRPDHTKSHLQVSIDNFLNKIRKHEQYRNITSGQKIFMKGCITVLSPLTAANGSVRPWSHLIHASYGPYWVWFSHQTETVSRPDQPFLRTLHQTLPMSFNGAGNPQKLSLPCRIRASI